MTPKEITEGNRIIAEFMGLKKRENGKYAGLYEDDHGCYPEYLLGYYTYWNWLMPVVEKIESLNYEVSIASQMSYENDDRELILYHDVIISDSGKEFANVTDLNKIEAVWLAVLEFIKWYNQQK